jgi:hypothetical protein
MKKDIKKKKKTDEQSFIAVHFFHLLPSYTKGLEEGMNKEKIIEEQKTKKYYLCSP